MRYRLSIVVLVVELTGTIFLPSRAVFAQTLQQQKQLQAQQKKAISTEAKRAMDAAKEAEAKAAVAKKNLLDVSAQIKTAQQAVDEATKSLKALEDEIIDGQAADSAFGKLRDEFRSADKKYQEARKSVLETAEFSDRLAKARELDDAANAVLALKKEFDDMPEIAEPRAKLQEIKEQYDPQRAKILEADSKWADADKDLKDKKKSLDELKRHFTVASAAASKAKAEARKAEAVAAQYPVPPPPSSKRKGQY